MLEGPRLPEVPRNEGRASANPRHLQKGRWASKAHMQGRDSPKEVYGLSPEAAKGHKGVNPPTKGNYLD